MPTLCRARTCRHRYVVLVVPIVVVMMIMIIMVTKGWPSGLARSSRNMPILCSDLPPQVCCGGAGCCVVVMMMMMIATKGQPTGPARSSRTAPTPCMLRTCLHRYVNNNDSYHIERRSLRFLQSPHCAMNCFQHIHSRGQATIVCK